MRAGISYFTWRCKKILDIVTNLFYIFNLLFCLNLLFVLKKKIMITFVLNLIQLSKRPHNNKPFTLPPEQSSPRIVAFQSFLIISSLQLCIRSNRSKDQQTCNLTTLFLTPTSLLPNSHLLKGQQTSGSMWNSTWILKIDLEYVYFHLFLFSFCKKSWPPV